MDVLPPHPFSHLLSLSREKMAGGTRIDLVASCVMDDSLEIESHAASSWGAWRS